jgi:threonylcarbamoyladenosine tRNA methylthiotransferase MtaB
MGCWPEVYKIKKVKGIDLVWGTGGQEALVKKIIKLTRRPIIINKSRVPFAATDRVRYFLKIEDGCEQFCSYCVIPLARGPIKSCPLAEVIDEVGQASEAGYKEIVLTGTHLGLYGRDLRGKNVNLTRLLKKILKVAEGVRIRLSSIEVNEVTDELLALAKANKNICRHFHIPLQSGSDKILKLMNRPYSTKMFNDKIKEIKRALPLAGITTDVIVGFPGEGEKEFAETAKFIEKTEFSSLHVFPYSEHEMAPAAKLPYKVDAQIINGRTKTLRALGIKLEKKFRNKFKGREVEIIIENIKKGRVKAKTSEYLDIEVPSQIRSRTGELVKIKLK